MTQTILDNLQSSQKTQTKHIYFHYNGSNQATLSGETLTVYSTYQESLNLVQFPNLRSIILENGVVFASLESIDISENTKINRIIFKKQLANSNLSYQPWANNSSGSWNLLAKEKQLNQVIVSYWHYKTNPQATWVEKNKTLRNQSTIPYCLIEDRKAEQLEIEVAKLNQSITEKNQQIESLKRQTEQTPTLSQFQELNSLALPSTELNFNNLKQEIKRLKLKDFLPYFQEKKGNFEQLTVNAKNKTGDILKSIIDLFLQTQKQILEQENESENSFAKGQLQGQLITCQTLLQTKLTSEELQNLLTEQKEFLQLEKQLTILQPREESRFEAHTEVPLGH